MNSNEIRLEIPRWLEFIGWKGISQKDLDRGKKQFYFLYLDLFQLAKHI